MKKKGRLSKLLSVVVSAAMALSCFSATAFAAGETSEHTISPVAGHTLELYQIFTGQVDEDDIIAQLQWGENAISGKTGYVTDDEAGEITGVSSSSTNTQKLDVIEHYVNLDSTPFNVKHNISITQKESGFEFTGEDLVPGYYLVRDKEGTLASAGDSDYTIYVAKVSKNKKLEITLKTDAPTVEKGVSTTQGNYTSNIDASVGQTVYFELIGHISSKISDFAQYYYEFSDDLSSGLTYSNNTVKVYLDSVSDANDVTKYFYVNNELAEDGSTHLTVAISDLKQLNNVKDGDTQKYTVAAGTKIYVTYEAALNQNAVTTSSTDNGGNPNTVKIVYTNNPNNSGTATTEEPTDYSDSDNSSDKPEPPTDTTTGSSVEKFARVYTAAIKIVKTDEDGAVLSGAKFGIKAKGNTTTLSEVVTINTSYIEATDDNSSENSVFYTKDNDGVFTVVSDTTDPQVTKYIVDTTSSTKSLVQTATKSDYDNENYFVGEVSDDGIVAFSGLGQGDYTITETQAPENYNRGDDLEISIEFDSNNKTFSVTGASFTAASDGYLGDVFIGYIQNGKGSQLPTTGGIGTTIFYVVGTILVLGAGVALVVRRRMRKETHQI